MTAIKTYTVAEIAALIENNDRAVERGILAIYALQTADEQADGATKHHNGVGFTGWAANSGSYYARWLQSGRHLSGKHLDKARKICLHHAKQLTRVANKEM